MPQCLCLAARSCLPIDQHGLLPPGGRLVGAMNAARPAAGALLALQQFLGGPLDAALARLRLFGVVHPADKLIAAERCQAFPQRKDRAIRQQSRLKILTGLVHGAMWKSARHAGSKRWCQKTRKHLTGKSGNFPFRAETLRVSVRYPGAWGSPAPQRRCQSGNIYRPDNLKNLGSFQKFRAM